MNIEKGIRKLNSLLPLKERQQALSPELKSCHRDILDSFLRYGAVKKNIDIAQLDFLDKKDLIVLDENKSVIGAYPFSLRRTEHQVSISNVNIYAMCALDAVAIAPAFNVETSIRSQCRESKEAIEITQSGDQLIAANPSKDICVGIRWQSPNACSADSLCMDMVFLKNNEVALKWQGKSKDCNIFSLQDAIIFAKRYFEPLLHD